MILRNLIVYLTSAPGGTYSRTLTLYKNSIATSMTVTLTGSVTTAQDTSNNVSVTMYDTVSVYATQSSSSAASSYIKISIDCTFS
jgi:hypothetical protein